MASALLAVVLVAALVVPLAVVPGSFGYRGWPTAPSEQVTEQPVRDAPQSIQVVKTSPPGSARAGTRPSATPGDTQASEPQPLVAAVPGPHRDRTPEERRNASGPGRNSAGAGPGEPGAPAAPATPSTPASEPEQPSDDVQPDQIAEGDTPVLRDTPAAPEEPATPIEPVAPVLPSLPDRDDSEDCDSEDDDDSGHGLVRGIAGHLGHGRGNGRGHAYGHGRN